MTRRNKNDQRSAKQKKNLKNLILYVQRWKGVVPQLSLCETLGPPIHSFFLKKAARSGGGV